MSRRLATLGTAALLLAPGLAAQEDAPLVLVVMDPLAAQLACPCVEGYAQRNYAALGSYLEGKLGRPVQVAFAESLATALEKKTEGKADLVIGKHSVILAEAARAKRELVPIASLTDKEGTTTQTGLFVVRSADPAKGVADLKGYRILFGPADCDEKSAAPRELLAKHGVPAAKEPETSKSCSTAATKLIELKDVRAAAVISSYAQPLLEGCGTIDKGALRVIGETDPVPFITAFAARGLSEATRATITTALLDVAADPDLCTAMESKGFVAVAVKPAEKAGEKPTEPEAAAQKKSR